MKLGLSDLSIIATLIIALIGTALTFQTEIVWVGQDFAGIPSLFFLIAVILMGARLAGRLKTPQDRKGVNLFGIHKKFGVFFAFLVIVTFIIGLWGRIFHGELFFWEDSELSIAIIHGWFGLLITILALLQVVPSIVTKDRGRIRRLHLIIGYLLLIVIIIQILSGIGAAIVAFVGK